MLDAWQTDAVGGSLYQLHGFQRTGGVASNGSIVSGSATSDTLLSLTADQTWQSKGSLTLPSHASAVPVVMVHGRLTLGGSTGSAGIGLSDSSSTTNWYYLLLNGT